MPYGDKEKQKLYQQLYYKKFIRKTPIKKKGNLKIDLMNLKPEPLKDVRINNYTKPFYSDYFTKIYSDEKIPSARQEPIDFVDKKGNLKTNKEIKKEIEERIVKQITKKVVQPTKPLLKRIELYGNNEDEEEDKYEVKLPKALDYYTKKESYLRNPFLLKIQNETAFNYQVKEEIPRWIRKMTDDKIINKAEELSKCITDEEFDKILNYCNGLFGNNKSRTKREFILKELYQKCQLSNQTNSNI